MSTEQTIDPAVIEQTKQQIRELVREIAQISKTEIAPLQFYEAFLNRIVAALAAVGGAVWMLNESGQLELEYQINIRQTRLPDSREDQMRHGRLLHKVLTDGDGMLVAPHSGAADEAEGANPTDFLLVLGPLKTSSQDNQGVIEVFQRPENSVTVQRGYLRFLMQMCELAGDYLKTRKLRHFSDRQTLWAQFEQFTRVVHRGLDLKLTAYTIANEGRRLIDCDRVSVGIRKGRKCVIEAVSGQDTFDKRSNTVWLLTQLATAVAATGEPIWYTGDTADFAPQVEEAMQAYVDESHSKTVAVIPLKRPRDDSEDIIKQNEEPPEVIGALIIEQIEDSQPKEGLPQRVEIVSEHSALALSNTLEHNDLFLMPVWRTSGKISWVVKGRTLPKTLSIAAAVVALFVALFVWPGNFELQSKGELEPSTRRDIFAEVDGTVIDVPIKHGQLVQVGDVLARLRNTDLAKEITGTEGDLQATRDEVQSIERQLSDQRSVSESEAIRYKGRRIQLQQKERSLKLQLDLLREKEKKLTVRSPIVGHVTTWQLQQLLMHRPMHQGETLMNLADPNGDWILELHMPENRIGYVAEAQKKIQPDLPVTYILATNPGAKRKGYVKEVQSIAEVHGEEGNTVLVRVAIDKHDLSPTERRQGTGVTAKVYCGRAPIGFVWFHDVIAFGSEDVVSHLIVVGRAAGRVFA